MKNLYLIRHAKSSWENPSLTDFNRPLNERGKRDAPFMGKILSGKNILPDIVYSSSAKRALKTAKIICEKINFPVEKIKMEDTIYEASVTNLLKIVQSTEESNNSVMLFGHNPGLTSLQNKVCEKEIDNIPTCGIVCIEFDCLWEAINDNTGELIFFEYPKKYFN